MLDCARLRVHQAMEVRCGMERGCQDVAWCSAQLTSTDGEEEPVLPATCAGSFEARSASTASVAVEVCSDLRHVCRVFGLHMRDKRARNAGACRATATGGCKVLRRTFMVTSQRTRYTSKLQDHHDDSITFKRVLCTVAISENPLALARVYNMQRQPPRLSTT